jgi:hypothetical protein
MNNAKIEKVIELVYNSYKNINFIERYSNIFPKYLFEIDSLMKKMDKKENLKILAAFGYVFKILTPGQYYNYEETFGNIKLILTFQISGGVITPYIFIFLDEINIDYKYNFSQNLGFIYKKMTNNYEQTVNAFCFRNFDDFKNAVSDIISIYEDFKKEFLKLLKENDLLEKLH